MAGLSALECSAGLFHRHLSPRVSSRLCVRFSKCSSLFCFGVTLIMFSASYTSHGAEQVYKNLGMDDEESGSCKEAAHTN